MGKLSPKTRPYIPYITNTCACGILLQSGSYPTETRATRTTRLEDREVGRQSFSYVGLLPHLAPWAPLQPSVAIAGFSYFIFAQSQVICVIRPVHDTARQVPRKRRIFRYTSASSRSDFCPGIERKRLGISHRHSLNSHRLLLQ